MCQEVGARGTWLWIAVTGNSRTLSVSEMESSQPQLSPAFRRHPQQQSLTGCSLQVGGREKELLTLAIESKRYKVNQQTPKEKKM
jgi:hypothetical protein